jgi:hypothetical protein
VATQDPVRQRAVDVDDKGPRVRRYHDATVKEAVALMAAMGASSPAELTHDMGRIVLGADETLSYADAYRWLTPGELLEPSTDTPADWVRDWERADADSFRV